MLIFNYLLPRRPEKALAESLLIEKTRPMIQIKKTVDARRTASYFLKSRDQFPRTFFSIDAD
jgi:hypothetical protein